MSNWLKNCFAFVILLMMMSAFNIVSAVCPDVSLRFAQESTIDFSSRNNDIADAPSVSYSYGSQALYSFIELLKTGGKIVRKLPLALVAYLALQQAQTLPGTNALSVTNSYQILSYTPDGPAVPILQMTINNSSSPYFVVGLRTEDLAVGTIMSMGKTLYFARQEGNTRGNWITQGNKTAMNTLLSGLSLLPARGYRNSIYYVVYICEGTCPPGSDLQAALNFVPPNAGLSATNLNQTLSYEIDGQAEKIKPILINSPATLFAGQLELLDKLSGSLTTSIPGSSWRFGITAGKSSVEAFFAGASLTPAPGYTAPIYIAISIIATNEPKGNVTGMIVISPVNSSPTIVTQTSTSKIAQMSTSFAVASTTIPISTSTGATLPQTNPSSRQIMLDSSLFTSHSAMSTFDGTTTLQDISDSQSTKDVLNSEKEPSTTPIIIGCIVGGVLLYATIAAGVVLLRKISKKSPVVPGEVVVNSNYGVLPPRSHYNAHIPPQQDDYVSDLSNIHKAAEEGDCYLLEVFLGFNVPIDSENEEGFTPLQVAARAGKEDACKLLIAKGANKEDKKALILAQENGHNHLIGLLS